MGRNFIQNGICIMLLAASAAFGAAACGGAEPDDLREDSDSVSSAEDGLPAPDENFASQDASQGLELVPANNLNYCCFKCQFSGEAVHKAFGGQHCKIVADNHCQAWGLGNGKEARQCSASE